MAVGTGGLVVAGAPNAVIRGERAFVESILPGAGWMTYSSVLDSDDCSAIDREAYVQARAWYRSADGDSDLTEVQGVSLGHAYELRATAMLVAYLRARAVLARLAQGGGGTTVDVRTSARNGSSLRTASVWTWATSLGSRAHSGPLCLTQHPSVRGPSDGCSPGLKGAVRTRLTLP